DGHRRSPARRQRKQRLGVVLATNVGRPKAPQLKRQRSGGGFERLRNVNVVGSEPHPVLSQSGPRILIERLDLALQRFALQYPERIRNLCAELTDRLGLVLEAPQRQERPEQ